MFKHVILSLVLVCGLMHASSTTEVTSTMSAVGNTFIEKISNLLLPAGDALEDAVSFLSMNRKPIIASTVVLTVAAAAAVAYSQGWFANTKANFEKAKAKLAKAKAWTLERFA